MRLFKSAFPFFTFQMLDDHDKTAGGLIMVFTDGEETERLRPNIEQITPAALESEAIIHSLLIDEFADDHNLIKLSIDTGGDFCIYEDSGSGGIDYYQCLMNVIGSSGMSAAFEVQVVAKVDLIHTENSAYV